MLVVITDSSWNEFLTTIIHGALPALAITTILVIITIIIIVMTIIVIIIIIIIVIIIIIIIFGWKVRSGVEMRNMRNLVNYCLPLIKAWRN